MFTDILENVGNTPLVQLRMTHLPMINLMAKLEYFNPTGSVKDRAALYILKKLLNLGHINKDTIIIESSSGNFGISLSSFCKKFGLQFYCVVDPNITPVNEKIIKTLSSKMIKVTSMDHTGGYLLKRIEKVKELLAELPNSYWVNQYANQFNAEAYYHTLGNEICDEVNDLSYIFIGVSSGGTITGVSRKIKERYPKAKVIAVDSVGSVIFGGQPRKRYIPGIGSSMVPEILKYAKIDEIVMVDEVEAVKMCNLLLKDYAIFAGGSSGSVIAAISGYFKGKTFESPPNVVTVFPDRGDRYFSTIYNDEWCRQISDNHVNTTENKSLSVK